MRLDKFLSAGAGKTRSEVKQLIKSGNVTVNGSICKSADTKINENEDRILLCGEEVGYRDYFYYLLHKPAGTVTACRDERQKTVMDLMEGAAGRDLSPVGRLDKDAEGLLLITNDGTLAHRLLSPKNHIPKTYYVRTAYALSDEALAQLEEGVDIGDDAITLPAKVEKLTEKELLLTITEGRFHQVKRMLAATDNEVLYLKRISMGNLTLPKDLPCGTYRELSEEEINCLRESASWSK